MGTGKLILHTQKYVIQFCEQAEKDRYANKYHVGIAPLYASVVCIDMCI